MTSVSASEPYPHADQQIVAADVGVVKHVCGVEVAVTKVNHDIVSHWYGHSGSYLPCQSCFVPCAEICDIFSMSLGESYACSDIGSMPPPVSMS